MNGTVSVANTKKKKKGLRNRAGSQWEIPK